MSATRSPGVHSDIPADIYHSDSMCSRPSLTASTAKLLISHSPLHAWTHHPRLNPAFERVDEPKFDVGTAAHELLLKGEQIVQVIDAADWRTNAAKAERDEARANGLVPLLAGQWEQVQAMVSAVRSQLEHLDVTPPLLTDGKPEQTLVWEEQGVLCRARLDWLRDDLRAIDDLKTTSATASPYDWTRRTFWTIGADIQAVFYQHGIRALTGKDPAFRFIVCETDPPYAVSVVDLAPSVVAIAEQKVHYALALWRRCLDRDEWPGYSSQVASIEVDGWQEVDFLTRTGGTAVAA